MVTMEIKKEDAPHAINVSIDPEDWVWLQTHKRERNFKASSLLRMAIRERRADEGGAWATKQEMQHKLENLQGELKKLWTAIEEAGKSTQNVDIANIISKNYQRMNALAIGSLNSL